MAWLDSDALDPMIPGAPLHLDPDYPCALPLSLSVLRFRVDDALAAREEEGLPHNFNFLNVAINSMEVEYGEASVQTPALFVLMAIYLIIPRAARGIYWSVQGPTACDSHSPGQCMVGSSFSLPTMRDPDHRIASNHILSHPC